MSDPLFYIGRQAIDRRLDVDLSDVLNRAAAKAADRRFSGEALTGFGELEEVQRDDSDDDQDFMSREAIEARRDNDRLGFRG